MPKPPALPVADLGETCARFLKQVRPLLDEGRYAETAASLRRFQLRAGPRLQAALQEAARGHGGRSWLIDAWRASYLKIRTPLPLASNVGFSVQTRGKTLGEWAAALAAVCADYRHGRTAAPETPQGAPACTAQWQILRGAARVPQNGCDTFRIADAPGRHIGVLHNGFYYRFAALDERGEAYHPDTFKQALGQILAETEKNPFPVAVPCYLGGNAAARAYQALRADEGNAALADYLETDLFHIGIGGGNTGADGDLARATFVPQQDVWCYKPITLYANTDTGRLFLHCEHTWADGGMFKGVVGLAAAKLGRRTGKKAEPLVGRHAWRLGSGQKRNWPEWQRDYAEKAGRMRVESVTVPFGGGAVPAGMSHDALMQLLLQYAQLATYGSVRNTYEAVDASHFADGRTECVRPVSEASLAFALSLLQQKPDRALLDGALAEHRLRVKAAKAGQGADRHLLGLKLAAKKRSGRLPAFFQTEGYRQSAADFLSTSTLGDDGLIVNFAFAPTSAGGLGVNYTLAREGWLFTLAYPEAQKREVAIFLEALKQGGAGLLAFLDTRQG